MSTPEPDLEKTPELTPEAMAVLARARRSFALSIGLLVVGLMVIAGIVVYRASHQTSAPAETETASYDAASVKIPAGATVISAIASGGSISVTYRNGSATTLRIFNGKTGEIVRDVPLLSE